MAGVAVVVAFLVSRQLPEARDLFICPMHPAVTARAPSDCPICGMRLRRVADTQAAVARGGPEALVLSADAPEISRHDSSPATRRWITRTVRAVAAVDSQGAIAARLRRDDTAALAPGATALFVPAAGGPAVAVRLAEPTAAGADPSALDVRFATVRPEDRRRAGEVGWLQLADRGIDVLVVPAPAILESADGPFVLVAAPDGRTFSKRTVQLERVAASDAFVRSGLAEHERVATMSAFSLEAARKLAAEPSTAAAPPGSP